MINGQRHPRQQNVTFETNGANIKSGSVLVQVFLDCILPDGSKAYRYHDQYLQSQQQRLRLQCGRREHRITRTVRLRVLPPLLPSAPSLTKTTASSVAISNNFSHMRNHNSSNQQDNIIITKNGGDDERRMMKPNNSKKPWGGNKSAGSNNSCKGINRGKKKLPKTQPPLSSVNQNRNDSSSLVLHQQQRQQLEQIEQQQKQQTHQQNQYDHFLSSLITSSEYQEEGAEGQKFMKKKEKRRGGQQPYYHHSHNEQREDEGKGEKPLENKWQQQQQKEQEQQKQRQKLLLLSTVYESLTNEPGYIPPGDPRLVWLRRGGNTADGSRRTAGKKEVQLGSAAVNDMFYTTEDDVDSGGGYDFVTDIGRNLTTRGRKSKEAAVSVFMRVGSVGGEHVVGAGNRFHMFPPRQHQQQQRCNYFTVVQSPIPPYGHEEEKEEEEGEENGENENISAYGEEEEGKNYTYDSVDDDTDDAEGAAAGSTKADVNSRNMIPVVCIVLPGRVQDAVIRSAAASGDPLPSGKNSHHIAAPASFPSAASSASASSSSSKKTSPSPLIINNPVLPPSSSLCFPNTTVPRLQHSHAIFYSDPKLMSGGSGSTTTIISLSVRHRKLMMRNRNSSAAVFDEEQEEGEREREDAKNVCGSGRIPPGSPGGKEVEISNVEAVKKEEEEIEKKNYDETSIPIISSEEHEHVEQEGHEQEQEPEVQHTTNSSSVGSKQSHREQSYSPPPLHPAVSVKDRRRRQAQLLCEQREENIMRRLNVREAREAAAIERAAERERQRQKEELKSKKQALQFEGADRDTEAAAKTETITAAGEHEYRVGKDTTTRSPRIVAGSVGGSSLSASSKEPSSNHSLLRRAEYLSKLDLCREKRRLEHQQKQEQKRNEMTKDGSDDRRRGGGTAVSYGKNIETTTTTPSLEGDAAADARHFTEKGETEKRLFSEFERMNQADRATHLRVQHDDRAFSEWNSENEYYGKLQSQNAAESQRMKQYIRHLRFCPPDDNRFTHHEREAETAHM